MSAKIKDPKQKSTPRTISLPLWLWDRIDEIVEPNKKSKWIRKWVEFGIEDHEENEALASSPVFQRIVADAKKIGSDS